MSVPVIAPVDVRMVLDRMAKAHRANVKAFVTDWAPEEARAAVDDLIAALENSDAWIREMRVQHGLQATATIDQNRAALARCKGGAA